MAGDALVPLEHHLLGLCLCTESNRRKEWPLIAQVIYNRVASPRYPDTAVEVILQRAQFSAFNPYTKSDHKMKPAEIFQAHFWKVAKPAGGAALLAYAIDHASKMVEADAEGQRISDLITPATLHYWSPVSLDPKTQHRDAEGFRAPYWWPTATRIYTPEGFDPERFRFAENVP
jgi:hypothetical protein